MTTGNDESAEYEHKLYLERLRIEEENRQFAIRQVQINKETAIERLNYNLQEYKKTGLNYIKFLDATQVNRFHTDYKKYFTEFKNEDAENLKIIDIISILITNFRVNIAKDIELSFKEIKIQTLKKILDFICILAVEPSFSMKLTLKDMNEESFDNDITTSLSFILKHITSFELADSKTTPKFVTEMHNIRQLAGKNFTVKHLTFKGNSDEQNALLQKLQLTYDQKTASLLIKKDHNNYSYQVINKKQPHQLTIAGVQADTNKDIKELFTIFPADEEKHLAIINNAFYSTDIKIFDPSVTKLDLTNNQLSAAATDNLKGLLKTAFPQLKTLVLNNLTYKDSKLETNVLNALHDTSGLTVLELKKMPLNSGSNPSILLAFIEKNPQLEYLDLSGAERSPQFIEALTKLLATSNLKLNLKIDNPTPALLKLLEKNKLLPKLKSAYFDSKDQLTALAPLNYLQQTDQKTPPSPAKLESILNALLIGYEAIPLLVEHAYPDEKSIAELRNSYESQICNSLRGLQATRLPFETLQKHMDIVTAAFNKAENRSPAITEISNDYINYIFELRNEKGHSDLPLLAKLINYFAETLFPKIEKKSQPSMCLLLINKALETSSIPLINQSLHLAQQNNIDLSKIYPLIIQFYSNYNSDEKQHQSIVPMEKKLTNNAVKFNSVKLMKNALDSFTDAKKDQKSLNTYYTAILNFSKAIDNNELINKSPIAPSDALDLLNLLKRIPTGNIEQAKHARNLQKNIFYTMINELTKEKPELKHAKFLQFIPLINTYLTGDDKTEMQEFLISCALPLNYALPNQTAPSLGSLDRDIQKIEVLLSSKENNNKQFILSQKSRAECETALLTLIEYSKDQYYIHPKYTDFYLELLFRLEINASNYFTVNSIAKDLIRHKIYGIIVKHNEDRNLDIRDILFKDKDIIGRRTDIFITNLKRANSLKAISQQIEIYQDSYLINGALQKELKLMIAPINNLQLRIDERLKLTKKQPVDFNIDSTNSTTAIDSKALTAASSAMPAPSAPPLANTATAGKSKLTPIATALANTTASMPTPSAPPLANAAASGKPKLTPIASSSLASTTAPMPTSAAAATPVASAAPKSVSFSKTPIIINNESNPAVTLAQDVKTSASSGYLEIANALNRLSGLTKTTINPDLFDEDYLCAISKEIMTDPVNDCFGTSYDKKNIQKWIESCIQEKRPVTSPGTGGVLLTTIVSPNLKLRKDILKRINELIAQYEAEAKQAPASSVDLKLNLFPAAPAPAATQSEANLAAAVTAMPTATAPLKTSTEPAPASTDNKLQKKKPKMI